MSEITNNPSVPTQVVAEVKFPRFINNLGIIPTSYKDSMSYYETLAWLCKYLEETVIPTVNENGEAVEELQSLYTELNTYVTNYFTNLDVQEEINEKLDDMVEQGTLQEIIGEYLESTAIWGFDTVASMKLSTNLINGSFAKTLGYYSKNDGGSATYKIRTITNDDVVDNRKIISLSNNELIAELILTNPINVLQQGVKNNGEDTILDIQAVIDNNPNKTLFFPSGTYLVSNSIYTPAQNDKSVKLKLSKYAIIKASSNYNSNDDYIVMIGGKDKTTYTRYSIGSEFGLEGGIVNCNNIATGGIEYNYGVGGFIKNVEVRNCVIGVHVPYGTNNGSNDLLIENISTYGDNSINSVGLLIEGNDNIISNVRTFGSHKGVIINRGGNKFTNIHCLYSNNDKTNYNASIGFELNSSNNTLDFCYSDNFSNAFYINTNGRNVFRSAWAYYYEGGNYNHIAFKFTDFFSAIIDDLYVGYINNEGTNTVLDVTNTTGGGKLRNLRISNNEYVTSSTDNCFNPYYNKDYQRRFAEDLTNVVGSVLNLNLVASNNMVNINFNIQGLTISSGTSQTLFKLPVGFYNTSMSSNLVALITDTGSTKKFECWMRANGEVVLKCNEAVTSSNKILITGSYCI